MFWRSPRQKAELLPRLDGGARQDDAVDLVRTEGAHRHGHGEVGSCGAGGADADGDRVVADRLDVPLLPEGLGLDRLAVVVMHTTSSASAATLVLAPLADHRHDIADVLFGERLPLLMRESSPVMARTARETPSSSPNTLISVPRRSPVTLYSWLDEPDVLIEAPEQRQRVLHPVDIHQLFDHSFFSILFLLEIPKIIHDLV